MISPYLGLPIESWENRTRELIDEHPLEMIEINDVVLKVWNDIFSSGIGSKPFKIGEDLFPRPQIMAYFLHELIPLEFSRRYPGTWRREETADEKDLVYTPDPKYSVEIKTSSSAKSIFGNRSYAQETDSPKKNKSGYYLAVNFEKFKASVRPKIVGVRFGWLDYSDWIGQAAATGQQARLDPSVGKYKLLKLPLQ
ncbi:MAG: ScaI family restriction endonuclease [Anaerolineae bacterium]|nr:ScaI family restriction endonuclease [Anaerolineae bacterium]